MASGYRITGTPEMEDGMLAGVSFVAKSEGERHEWFTRNCGQFPIVFARVMPRQTARVMLASLEAGDCVEFPGRYSEEQFGRQFALEWSPLHFLRPPQFTHPGEY